MVDGHSVGWVSTQHAAETRRSAFFSAVCCIPDAARSKTNAESKHRRTRLALRRRVAFGRSDASAGNSGDRALRLGLAAARWRADSPGRALEIRIQEHQVDCKNHARGRSATDNLEHRSTERIWLLFK